MTTKELRANQWENIYRNQNDESKNHALAFIIGFLESSEQNNSVITPTEILDEIYFKLNTSKK